MTYSLFERMPYEKDRWQRFTHSYHFTCHATRFTYTAGDRATAEDGIRQHIKEKGGTPKFDGGHVVEDENGKRQISKPEEACSGSCYSEFESGRETCSLHNQRAPR